ncbi:helix-turn-helix transcriptional regulator [Geobacillus thermodenitrificans]|uniref:helix-turn-helix transcriptional regulator n=1 Tax=Geobacillus thermodenitrificans TaxID=33940 RepID=UPI001E2F0555|nr:helix-turn-helix transcriptional regulator [Geobacillus thermodenitrificans]
MRIKIKIDKLKEYMRRNNLSERDLARRMGVAHVTVYRVLRKKREPGNEFIAKLLNVFEGATFEELFYLEQSITKREQEVHK